MAGTIAALVHYGGYHQLPGAPSAHQPFRLLGHGAVVPIFHPDKRVIGIGRDYYCGKIFELKRPLADLGRRD